MKSKENIEKIIKTYKVFNPDWTCKGFKYEIGKSYSIEGQPIMCEKGFHACIKVSDCFSYYDFNPLNKIAEVELSGIILGENEQKQCASKIKIIKELSWEEMLVLANSGISNSGNSNSGDSNSGHCNSGDSNSGDRNSGDRNSGNSNSGDSNSGDSNSGDSNSGDSNSGDSNSGDSNSGDSNSGNSNSGDSNSGNSNSGDRNSGDSNSGDSNSGHWNSGHWNSGHSNSGHSNSGDWNSGDSNSGDSNSGHWNSGHWNSGDWNLGHWNSGYFNSDNPTVIRVFGKDCNATIWDNATKPKFIYNLPLNTWITWDSMTDQEKIDNKNAFVTEGYLKTLSYKGSWSIAYNSATKEDIELLKRLPNFDAKIFEEITGIKVK
jgi:hypothetical protein